MQLLRDIVSVLIVLGLLVVVYLWSTAEGEPGWWAWIGLFVVGVMALIAHHLVQAGPESVDDAGRVVRGVLRGLGVLVVASVWTVIGYIMTGGVHQYLAERIAPVWATVYLVAAIAAWLATSVGVLRLLHRVGGGGADE